MEFLTYIVVLFLRNGIYKNLHIVVQPIKILEPNNSLVKYTFYCLQKKFNFSTYVQNSMFCDFFVKCDNNHYYYLLNHNNAITL